MRLTQIKLSGFKSFVDHTLIPTPSDLVGVVGPNGCGKSNIIDAVRWVLGESRASELRGASMQDVIFNGSGERKAAARASVELVFDNSLGRAAGQWSSYSEISVRRVLTRDGGSSYFINKQLVRRRDVHDIFLGTGLGAKGYAIIGQGMINRLIEARPEELRVYLEEAAGVSRYKERRRETENRLRDTRENLVRLEDIISELERQLEKLQAQAELAKQYQDLQKDATIKLNALYLLREQAAKENQQKLASQYEQEQLKLESMLAKLSSAQAEVEKLRTEQFAANDGLHNAQAKLFTVSSAVSGYEAEIKHVLEAKKRLQARKTQLQVQLQQWQDQASHCVASKADIELELEHAVGQHLELDEMVLQAQQGLPELDDKLQNLHDSREICRQKLARSEQNMALARQAATEAKQQWQRLEDKRLRLQQQLAEMDKPDLVVIDRLAENYEIAQAKYEQAEEQLLGLEGQLDSATTALNEQDEIRQQSRTTINQLQAQESALLQLQEKIQAKNTLQPWLKANNLFTDKQLWQRIQIEPGWEIALESVLCERMQALPIESLQQLEKITTAPPAKIAFYESAQGHKLNKNNSLTPLSALIHCQDLALQNLLQFWLQNVYVVDDLDAALRLRADCNGVLVLPNGDLIDRYSVRLYAPENEQAGLLARAQQLEQLGLKIKAAQLLLADNNKSYDLALQAKDAITQQIQQARQQIDSYLRAEHNAQLELQSAQQSIKNAQQQYSRLETDLQEVINQQSELSAKEVITDFADLAKEIEHGQNEINYLDEEIVKVSQVIKQARANSHDYEKQAQDAKFAVRSLRNRIAELERNLRLAKEQEENCKSEMESLQGELFELDENSAQANLDEALELKLVAEENLRQARIKQESTDADLRMADQSRLKIEQSCEPQRNKITELQLKEQASRLTIEQYSAYLDEHQVDRQLLQKHLVEQQWQNLSWLQSEVQTIKRKIESLGAVNLAALDELNKAQARQGFLAAQQADLQTAIETLESAIRKIDQETRSLLKDTFTNVNQHFAELFPLLFGGGKANLIMTGEEILDAGVQVMAQPPGKRNSTINLLSGGEKALTAIALVFAFFKLNPAPFCLLDEVDAPLDDANTERYANLVSRMSKHTQFLFISHNKIAMQIAKQLIGVTMQEQGVSRIVAVDMDTALQMALPAV